MPPAPALPQIFFMLCLGAMLLAPFVPLMYTRRSGGGHAMFFGIQVAVVLFGLFLGWSAIAPAVWEASGGCAAHGGGFEGGCGFAGLAGSVMVAIETAGIACTLSAVILYFVARHESAPDSVDSTLSGSGDPDEPS